MDKETWKTMQFAFIAKQSMDWINSTDPECYMNHLSIRHLSSEEFVWLKELAQETGLVEFTGHARPHGFVKGYRISDFTQKTIEYYSLLKYKDLYLSQQEQIQSLVTEITIIKHENDILKEENASLRNQLYDCHAELIQEKECEKERDNAVDIMLEKIRVMETKLDQFIS